jgi:hypothetical protein
MNLWIMEPPNEAESRNWRLGLGLALLALLYVAAVIAFIVIY